MFLVNLLNYQFFINNFKKAKQINFCFAFFIHVLFIFYFVD